MFTTNSRRRKRPNAILLEPNGEITFAVRRMSKDNAMSAEIVEMCGPVPGKIAQFYAKGGARVDLHANGAASGATLMWSTGTGEQMLRAIAPQLDAQFFLQRRAFDKACRAMAE